MNSIVKAAGNKVMADLLTAVTDLSKSLKQIPPQLTNMQTNLGTQLTNMQSSMGTQINSVESILKNTQANTQVPSWLSKHPNVKKFFMGAKHPLSIAAAGLLLGGLGTYWGMSGGTPVPVSKTEEEKKLGAAIGALSGAALTGLGGYLGNLNAAQILALSAAGTGVGGVAGYHMPT